MQYLGLFQLLQNRVRLSVGGEMKMYKILSRNYDQYQLFGSQRMCQQQIKIKAKGLKKIHILTESDI